MVAPEPVEREIALPSWIPAAFRAHGRLADGLSEPLARRLQRRLDRLAGAVGGLQPLLLSRAATPFLFLLDAYRRDLGIGDDDPRLPTLGEAALAFYLYVRVQDDLVYEPETCDRACVYLAEVLEGAALRAFAQAVGADAGFFLFRAETMREFSEYAARDADERADAAPGNADFAQAGVKFLPLAVLLGAVAYAGGRPDHCPVLLRFTRRLGAGLQAINDVLNVADDHREANATPVLRRLYAAGALNRDAPPTQAQWALLAHPTLRYALDQAREAIEEAGREARAIGAEGLAAVTRERLDYLQSVPRRLLSVSFGRKAEWD